MRMHVVLGEELELFVTCDPDEGRTRFVMRFRDTGRNAAGCGRTERWERVVPCGRYAFGRYVFG